MERIKDILRKCYQYIYIYIYMERTQRKEVGQYLCLNLKNEGGGRYLISKPSPRGVLWH